MESFRQIIEFIKETDKLKGILRHNSPIGLERRENDAEHSWQLALMAVLLQNYANEPVDIAKVVKMLLVHDLVEIYAGDVYFFDKKRDVEQPEIERQAAKKLYQMLPKELGEELYKLWYEFEFEDTAENRFAKSIDRFAPTLMNYGNQGGTWKKYGVPYDVLIGKLQSIQKGSEMLWQETKSYIDEGVKKGWVKSESNPNI